MLTVDAALGAMEPYFSPLAAERVPLGESLARCLAEEVRANLDVPGFDNSAMDGYALRFTSELTAGAHIPLQGEAAAGAAPATLVTGTAMRIFTGAPLPAGADTVVMQEQVRRAADGTSIELLSAVEKQGRHVRKRAGDVESGARLLPRRTAIAPGELALLASQGIASVLVHRRPTVAILTTGDELHEPGQPLPPSALYNSNGPALAALVKDAGGLPWCLPTAPDDASAIEARLEEARHTDLILTTGGVSVGDHDRVAEGLARAGAERVFWKIAMKPGKPLWFGTLPGENATPVVGLPGNPVSAMATFEIFVRPALRRMLGHAFPYRRTHRVSLSHNHTHSTGRDELARATLDGDSTGGGAGGRLQVTLHPRQNSGSLRSMCAVDALVWLPGAQREFTVGAELDALLLTRGSHAATPGPTATSSTDGPLNP